MSQIPLQSLKFPGLDSTYVIPAVGKIVNGGVVLNDFANNKINNDSDENCYALATGSHTLAGWRSYAGGYLTVATNTSHAEGRLGQATGKGAHVEGTEYYEELKTSDYNLPLLTLEPFHVGTNKVKIDGSSVNKNDILTFTPTSSVTGFGTTDARKVVETNTTTLDISNRIGDIQWMTNSLLSVTYLNAEECTIRIGVGDTITLYDQGSEPTVHTVSDVDTFGTSNYGELTVYPALDDSIDTSTVVIYHYTVHHKCTELTLDSTFIAENYYPGLVDTNGNVICPEDGYIPAGALVRKAFYNIASGLGAHSEGIHTIASGEQAHAEGKNTIASQSSSHAEGFNTQSTGKFSHAEGTGSIAQGQGSHAEGNGTHAKGNYSHTEGTNTITENYHAHAEGLGSRAAGEASHAEGGYTWAKGKYQHVEGQYNVIEGKDSKGRYFAHVVGNGSSDSRRSNAYTLDWDGNGIYAGIVTCGKTSVTGSKDLVPKAQLDAAITNINNNAVGRRSTGAGAEIFNFYGDGTKSNYSFANYSHAEGYCTGAGAVWKTDANGNFVDADGNIVSSKDKCVIVTAGGGNNGRAAHAEGQNTIATGSYSHSEGIYTRAVGAASHTEGRETVAEGDNEHVQGKFNLLATQPGGKDTKGRHFAHVLGNGSSEANRKNAHTIDWDGNAWYSGSISADGGFILQRGKTYGTQAELDALDPSKLPDGYVFIVIPDEAD